MKPILKWAGGKTKIRNRILELFPDHFRRYWEPFAGSCAVSLAVHLKHPDRPIFLSDINQDLIHFYQDVRDHTNDLIHSLEEISDEFLNCENKRNCYEQRREQFNESQGLERSIFFYFLNKTSFNGLTRYNGKGKYNVPFGKRDFNMDIMGIREFAKFLNLSNVDLRVSDFENISPSPGDIVYLDPPYHPLTTTSSFTQYQPDSWSETNEYRLKSLCDRWTIEGVYVVLSNNDVPFIRDLFHDYTFSEINVTKSVGASGATRKKTPEVLISNRASYDLLSLVTEREKLIQD